MAGAKKKPEKIVQTKGKKKKATARLRLREGRSGIKVNGIALEHLKPELAREIITEPLELAKNVLGADFSRFDIDIGVYGGGVMGRAYACRTALGKALVEFSGSAELKKAFLDYDRSLLIDDVRMKEPKKYLRLGARAKPTKSYR